MTKPRILLTNELPEESMEYLKKNTTIELLAAKENTKKDIIKNLKNKEALVCLLTDVIDAEIMDANPDLKVIVNVAVGYNNIDVAEASKRKIPVTNTPGVLTETSADLAFSLLMASARRIVEADNYLRSGKWEGWGMLQFLGADIYGATLGVIGMGRIGKALVRRAKGFDMKIMYWNRTRLSTTEEEQMGLTYATFEEVLRESDFVSLHVSYTQDTHHLLDKEAFSLMKKTAKIINTSRGAVIDEQALVDALQSGKIGGAGLDVFEYEPKVHPELTKLKNVVLLPHIGSATSATRNKMGFIAVDNLVAALSGRIPPNVVNPEIYG